MLQLKTIGLEIRVSFIITIATIAIEVTDGAIKIITTIKVAGQKVILLTVKVVEVFTVDEELAPIIIRARTTLRKLKMSKDPIGLIFIQWEADSLIF